MKDKIFEIVKLEQKRQEETINLIASENYAPQEILELTGSVLTNKYAEGLPGKRYYAGTQFIDSAETLAIERIKKLFKAEHANVQPHSGAQANMAAYFALINTGDKVLAMDLSHGGHLTHGSGVNFSGKFYNFTHYGVDPKTHLINYDIVQKLARKHRPKLIVAGYSSYSRKIDFKKFRAIADSIGAYLLVDMAHFAGIVAGGAYPNPTKYADVVTSTTHKTLRGPRGGVILSKKKFAKQIDKAVFPGIQGGPLEHVIAAKALCFELASKTTFKNYAKQVVNNSRELSGALKKFGYDIISGGTDNHMFVINIKKSEGITGHDAQLLLERANIVVNRNVIPFDTESPFVTSGIRFGTPAVTTRGMKEKEMWEIAEAIDRVLNTRTDSLIKKTATEMKRLAKRFPIYR